jgi:hypothetical protein
MEIILVLNSNVKTLFNFASAVLLLILFTRLSLPLVVYDTKRLYHYPQGSTSIKTNTSPSK